MEFLRQFENQTAYNAAKGGGTLGNPCVSLIKDTMTCQFDPYVPTPSIEIVDLGLTSGLLWAKTNLGAQTETDYGNYYQWAATTPLHVEGTAVDPAADWSSCPYCTDLIDGSTFSKYTGSDYSTLQTSDDVAASKFTGYRMPTKEDFEELISETNKEWTSINGVYGYKFTNKSDSSKYIFLPAASSCSGSNLDGVGEGGNYWSSSLDTNYPYSAWHLFFDNEEVDMYNDNRYYGFSIRPVKPAA